MQKGYNPERQSKGFAVVFILIGTLVMAGAIVAGAYLVKQTVNFQPKAVTPVVQPTSTPKPQTSVSLVPTVIDETVYTEGTRSANWKTYANEKYKYTISYPLDWRITRKEFNEQLFKSLVEFTPNFSNTLINFVIRINNETYQSLYQELKNLTDQYSGKSVDYKLGKDFVLSKRFEFVTGAGNSDYAVNIIFEHGDTFFIEANFSNPPKKPDLDRFDQILATFKFLK